MIAHLKDRAAALAALGWTGADAEWLAFVCLQSGAFLRSQYLRYVGESHPMHARRFVQRCRSIAVEVPWNGSAFLVCRIVAQPVVPGARGGASSPPAERHAGAVGAAPARV